MSVKKGYKQTEIGVIPEVWHVRKLDSVVIFFNGKAHENSISDAGDYIVVNSKFISTEGSVVKYSIEKYCQLLKNDVAIVMSDIPNGKALAKCFIIEKEDTYTLNQRIGGLRSLGSNPKFLYYQLNRNKYFLGFDSGSGQTNLRKQEVLDCPVILPPLPEQTAISNALSDMDALIAQTENLIEKKKAIKQGVMQELLKPKEGWVTKKLGEVVLRISTGLNPRTNFKLNAGGNNYYVTIKNFKNGNLFLDDKCDRIDDEALKLINNRSDLRVGDILLASIGRVGDLYLIKEQPKNWNINESVFTLRPNVSMIDPEYLCCLFDQDSIKSTLDNGATGSTFQSIKVGDLRKLELCFPAEIREQKEISSILTDMTFMIDQFEIRLKNSNTKSKA